MLQDPILGSKKGHSVANGFPGIPEPGRDPLLGVFEGCVCPLLSWGASPLEGQHAKSVSRLTPRVAWSPPPKKKG